MSVTTLEQLGGMIHTQAIVDFYNGAQYNDAKSQKEGRPIYDDVEMIRIRWAGNTKSELHAPANDRSDRPIKNREDNSRYYPKWKDHPDFKAAYDAFKAGQAWSANGTPIAELPFLTNARRMELQAVNIHTAEQLANLDQKTANKFGMDMLNLQSQARLYLQRASGAAVDAQHAAERQSMLDEMAAMRQQLDALLSGAAPPAPSAVTKKATRTRTTGPATASPFSDWEDADIRNWIKDVEPTAGIPADRAGLLKLADEINARKTAAA